MIRYRCPHCAALTAAHERRTGQSSVCKACLKPHAIPADRALWLTETGEPLHPPAPAAPSRPDLDLPATLPDVALNVVPLGDAPAAPVPREEPPTRPEFALPQVVAIEPARPPVPEPEPTPAPAVVATLTPPPKSAPRPAPAPVLTPPPRGGQLAPRAAPPTPTPAPVPVQLQTQADIAVALTAALSTRMKPRATPRRDVRPSTAIWMVLTGLGLALLILGLFSDVKYRWGVLAVGAAQVAAGYGWIVRLTYLRDPQRGAACALPPVTFYYLSQYKYAKLRPLRFVATGSVLAGLAALVSSVAPHTLALVRPAAQPTDEVAPAAPQSALAQLRLYRETRSYDSLCRVLEELAKADPLLSKEKTDRAELAAELKTLCAHPDTEVRIRAMAAYAPWDPPGARAVCLAAIRSNSFDDRLAALRLLPNWKDADSARAAQSLITRPGAETNQARAAVEEIGGEAAELAAETLLNRADDQAMRLTGLSIMEKVAGPGRVAWLRSYAQASSDSAVRDRALIAADAVAERAKRTPPPKRP
ncbi:MAG: hypothetical protein FJ304_13000 [Planctomycetes bacterium]|nr:hypothetical protein [Planctomycetota bacterium]